ncbi:STM4015 family protein [Streptomyces sp. MAR4 CNX-425]|uniref:STM4015 family protein n=1 Tax=Streptomyces sp. MAR4 CNX-425 TaxID=3406343 RepID=UPI003B514540
MYAEHVTELYGLPVRNFRHDDDSPDPLPDDPGSVAWRLATDAWDSSFDDFEENFRRFLDAVDPGAVRALVIGPWGEAYENDSRVVVKLLAGAADRFTALRAVFLGDLVAEEAEISWIEQSDVTPVLRAYPALEEFAVRGGTDLSLEAVRHDALKSLRFEAGGLPGGVVRAVAAAELPALEELTLWLGVGEYGGDATVADLAPLLAGGRLPALRRLAVCNSEIEDEIAVAVAAAPVVAQLEELDLSMGVLTDTGAEALLTGQPLTHLRRLRLAHHYLTTAMMRRLTAALEPAGVGLDLSEQLTPDTYDGEVWHYTAVME